MKDAITKKKKVQIQKIQKIKSDLKELLIENEGHDELEKLERDEFVIDLELLKHHIYGFQMLAKLLLTWQVSITLTSQIRSLHPTKSNIVWTQRLRLASSVDLLHAVLFGDLHRVEALIKCFSKLFYPK